eukprot:CAMPEP_0174700784 /NCGR_PEP_ID=MMETSP1094-20130205/5633_1 /TAXON_ID=156173 /ORGANISM="Chrysochromulina brevifilum, Strain UTEX LB 985" /LENGTH=127 /DNA_ID=CAMNT_0015898327 /DNA_START=408 /DNA_END=792 /DNA_ORIENTATION=-
MAGHHERMAVMSRCVVLCGLDLCTEMRPAAQRGDLELAFAHAHTRQDVSIVALRFGGAMRLRAETGVSMLERQCTQGNVAGSSGWHPHRLTPLADAAGEASYMRTPTRTASSNSGGSLMSDMSLDMP